MMKNFQSRSVLLARFSAEPAHIGRVHRVLLLQTELLLVLELQIVRIFFDYNYI